MASTNMVLAVGREESIASTSGVLAMGRKQTKRVRKPSADRVDSKSEGGCELLSPCSQEGTDGGGEAAEVPVNGEHGRGRRLLGSWGGSKWRG